MLQACPNDVAGPPHAKAHSYAFGRHVFGTDEGDDMPVRAIPERVIPHCRRGLQSEALAPMGAVHEVPDLRMLFLFYLLD